MESKKLAAIRSVNPAEESDKNIANRTKIVGPYVVATASGFLVSQDHVAGRLRVYTDPNVRRASTWASFHEADQAAKLSVVTLYPRELHYYSILVAPNIKQVVGD